HENPDREVQAMQMRMRERIRAWATGLSRRMGSENRGGEGGSGTIRARIPAWLPVSFCLVTLGMVLTTTLSRGSGPGGPTEDPFDSQIQRNANKMISDGRRIFRFDAFGDEAFWGGTLKLHEFVEGVTPRTALSVGLKVDVDALTPAQVEAIRQGRIVLDD